MTDRPGWYPPGQVCYPPELPLYLKNVHELKPIVGVPSDDEVIEIHAVLQAANRVSTVPGMNDPGLLMGLADHLFGAQMARYRSKYSLIVFPSDATYTPPILPAHVTADLESVSGVPSDEEMIKVQDALRNYQQFCLVPSMFDQRVNMQLSQHLFDLQMARYMRVAGESQQSAVPREDAKLNRMTPVLDQTLGAADEATACANNPGTGDKATERLAPGMDMCELMERSNQLAERFNQLLERSNALVERSTQPAAQTNQLTERFDQILDRFTQLVEKISSPAETTTDRFTQLFEQFSSLLPKLTQPMQQSNQLAERLNQLIGGFTQPLQRSNELAEQAIKPAERPEEVMKNINRVLVRIQHAIIRSHKGNTVNAVDCLINEKGETTSTSPTTYHRSFKWLSDYRGHPQLSVVIDGSPQDMTIPNSWLGEFLSFHGIGRGLLKEDKGVSVKEGKVDDARERLSVYLSSCLG